jgi:16S rRNA (cytidine1402-2'-O)-methyltransferase
MNWGVLYIVATPIGNLGDMSLRAIEVLKSVDIVAAEDTRHSGRLLQHFNIESKKMVSMHEHNEAESVKKCIAYLKDGSSVALISDAGTPLVSDPGYRLVQEARARDIRVVPIPGPCAAIAALSVSGLPSDRFVFEGFLPAKQQARLGRLEQLKSETRTLIFYEAPHRILNLCQDMAIVFGDERYVVIARELTKVFETVHGDSLSELIQWLKTNPRESSGEFVVVVQGNRDHKKLSDIQEEDVRILNLLLKELPLSQAASLAAKITGKKRNRLYQLAIRR